MRTVGLPPDEGEAVLDALEGMADACLDEIGEGGALALSMDDLTTPGTFWLNPCLPRDADGNSVDPETGLPMARRGGADDGGLGDDEDEAQQILRELGIGGS